MEKNEFYAFYNSGIEHANDALLNTVGNGSVTDPELQKIVFDLAKKEQTEAINTMSEQYDIDYAEAHKLSGQATQRIGEIAKMIAEYEAADEDKKRQLGIIAYYYAQAKEIPVGSYEDAIESLKQEQAALEADLQVDYDKHDYLLSPWVLPIGSDYLKGAKDKIQFPELLDWSSITESGASEAEYDEEWPDPRPVEEDGSIASRLREWGGRLVDAGKLALYSMATAEYGKTWTYQMIGDAIYDHNKRDSDRRASNAKSLINSYIHGNGSTIPEGLRELEQELELEEGSVAMQIGRRWLLKNGKRHGVGQRIARLLIPGNELPETVGSGDYEDEWCGRVGESVILDEAQAALANVAVKLTEETVSGSTTPHTESALFENGASDEDENSETNDFDDPANSSSGENERRVSWQESFRDSAEREIDKLIQNGLFKGDADTMPVGAVRGLGSNILGTETGDYRSRRAGIIKGNEDKYSLAQVVAMSMLNGNGEILSNKHRRSRALKIIAEIINSRRKEQAG